jgi:hypothetical protein
VDWFCISLRPQIMAKRGISFFDLGLDSNFPEILILAKRRDFFLVLRLDFDFIEIFNPKL